MPDQTTPELPPVGWGPTSWIGYLTAIGGFGTALSAGLLAIAGALPEGISPHVVAWLVLAAGIVGAASFGLTVFAREVARRTKVMLPDPSSPTPPTTT